MILKLSLNLPEDAAYVPIARHLGRGLLEYLNVNKADVLDAEAIIDELSANVVRHAVSAKGRFDIVLEYYSERIVITVIDTGQGFSFRDIPEQGTRRKDLDGGQRLGGYGLTMLTELSDDLQFSRTDPYGTTVRAEKRIRYQTKKAADDADKLSHKADNLVGVGGN